MKITKIVLGGQLAVIAVLLVVFMFQGGKEPPPEDVGFVLDGKGEHREHGEHEDQGDPEAHEDGEPDAGPTEGHAAKTANGHGEGHAATTPALGPYEEGETPLAPGGHGPMLGLKPYRLRGPATAIAAALLAGNNRFIASVRSAHDLTQQRQITVGGQKPPAIVLGCADSRVPPELIFDRGIGELFVIRNAGNLATKTAMGSIEYAIEHLHSRVLVVMGHEKCGAVTAALDAKKPSSPNLRVVVDEIAPAVSKLKGWADGAELVHMGVEANVKRQSQLLIDRSVVIRHAIERNELSILKAVYDLETGRVNPL